MEEKRVQLGVDIGELSNQLVQLNNLVEQNYQKAFQGQVTYNKVIEDTISLLQQQADLVSSLGQNNNGGGISTNSSSIIGSDSESKENELIDSILDSVGSIYEKISEFSFPIPVEIINISELSKGLENETGATGVQKTNNNDINEKQNSENISNNVARYTNAAASMFQRDPNYILAGAVGMIPVVGSGLAQILSRAIGEAEELENAEATLAATTGGHYSPISLTDIGLKNADAYLKQAALYRSNIYQSRGDFLFEKGFNIDSGTMSSFMQSLRRDFGLPDLLDKQYPLSSFATNYKQQLIETGNISDQQVRGYIEDYLSILIDLNQKQLETTGDTFSLLNGNIIAKLASLDEHFSDPAYLKSLVSNIYSSLRQAPTPQLEALQYYALSSVRPGASLWEMNLMKEDPFNMGSGYLSKYLEFLFNTGTLDDIKFNIRGALFGNDPNGTWKTERLVSGILDAKDTFESDIRNKGKRFSLQELLEGEGEDYNYDLTKNVREIINEAAKATAPHQPMIAEMSNFMAEDIGKPILEATRQIKNYVKNLSTTLSGYFSGSMDLTDVSQAIVGLKPAEADPNSPSGIKKALTNVLARQIAETLMNGTTPVSD